MAQRCRWRARREKAAAFASSCRSPASRKIPALCKALNHRLNMETQTNQQEPCPLPKRPKKKFHWKLSAIAVAVIAAVIFFCVSSPGRTTPSAEAESAPPVAVAKVMREDLAREIKI